jgi:GxxExxY protein
MNTEELNKLSAIILDAAITVQKEMGPGLLESVYEQCLLKEFEIRNIRAVNQLAIPLVYKGCE